MNDNLIYKIILLITCVFIIFLIYEIIDEIEKNREGFDIKKEAKKIGNSILSPIEKGLKKSIDKVGGGITKAVKKVGQGIKKIDTVGKAIVNVAKQVGNFFVKVGKAFAKIATVIYTGIIKPLLNFFLAIGNVFIQLITILMKIIMKIIQLPKCMPVYLFGGFYDGIISFYKAVIPGPLRDFIGLLWMCFITFPLWILYYVVAFPIDLMTKYFLGWSILNIFSGFFSTKCYDFDVEKNVKSMGNGFTSAASSFKKNFGKMDFKGIF